MDACALAMYLGVALLNHSCDPNCWTYFEQGGRRLQLRTLRAVAPGEPLTISYVNPPQRTLTSIQRACCCVGVPTTYLDPLCVGSSVCAARGAALTRRRERAATVECVSVGWANA